MSSRGTLAKRKKSECEGGDEGAREEGLFALGKKEVKEGKVI